MIEQAAFWSAQLATDETTQAERDACEAWCREHPLHRIAMDRMRAFDTQIDSTDDIGRETIQSLLDARGRKTRRIGGAALGVFAIAGAGWMAMQSLAMRAWFPDYETALGEQRTVTLADGSGLTLDTAASLDFDRAGDRRTVTLFRGQVLARVARDVAHPFVVRTGDGTATALGTAFTVRKDKGATTVIVLESKVRVCPAEAEPPRCADLTPGDHARIDQGRVVRLGRIDPETAGAWAEGWLAADDQPVADVLEDLNRYRAQPIRFIDADLAGVRVSGSFPLSDTNRALDGIVQSTGLGLSRAQDGSPVVGRTK